jgi:hypothetical protein
VPADGERGLNSVYAAVLEAMLAGSLDAVRLEVGVRATAQASARKPREVTSVTAAIEILRMLPARKWRTRENTTTSGHILSMPPIAPGAISGLMRYSRIIRGLQ